MPLEISSLTTTIFILNFLFKVAIQAAATTPRAHTQKTEKLLSPNKWGKGMELKCLAVVHQSQIVRCTSHALEFDQDNNYILHCFCVCIIWFIRFCYGQKILVQTTVFNYVKSLVM